MLAPDPDQIEITVFGPGYGECIVTHIGVNKWIVVDSCIDTATGEPASIKYLSDLRVDPGAVVRVVATHWHDDHIRGMARQIEVFRNARFCTSPALTRQEFLATIISYNSRHGIVVGSGASEMCKVLDLLRVRADTTTPMRAFPGRSILTVPAAESGHGTECRVITLSPSDKQFERFLLDLGKMAPAPHAAKKRIPDQDPNDLSVAILISIGDQAVLLGADLEESGDHELGWSAVVRMEGRPQNAASIFKLPHHGSNNGHCQEVWEQMVVPNPIAVLTPWNKNKRLPTSDDVARILRHTHSAFLTSFRRSVPARQRPYAVQKQIRETVGRLRAAQENMGYVRIRNGGKRNSKIWCIERSENACHLQDWRAT